MGGNLFFFFFAFPKSVYITFNEANFLLLIIAATTTTIIIIKHQTSTIPLQKKKSTIFLIFTFFGHYLALRSFIFQTNKQTNHTTIHVPQNLHLPNGITINKDSWERHTETTTTPTYFSTNGVESNDARKKKRKERKSREFSSP